MVVRRILKLQNYEKVRRGVNDNKNETNQAAQAVVFKKRLIKHFTFWKPQNPAIVEFYACASLPSRIFGFQDDVWQNNHPLSADAYPGRSIHDFGASKSADRRILCSSETPSDEFWGSTIVKVKVGSVRPHIFWAQVFKWTAQVSRE